MLKILIVDDERSIRETLSLILCEMGFEVAVACNGSEGLKLFNSTGYDLVLTDLQMPGLDGWSLAHRIKDQSPRTPVVLVTGDDEQTILKEMEGSSVDLALFKPFRLEDIEKTVQCILHMDKWGLSEGFFRYVSGPGEQKTA